MSVLLEQEYKYGFVSEVDTERLPPGLTEETIYAISRKKEEPEWLLQFRLKAFNTWKNLKEPHWAIASYPPIDYQSMSYFSAPKQRQKLNSFDEVDPEVLRTFEKLNIPQEEQARILNINVAVDMVFDSVSIATTFQKKLEEAGVVLMPISEAVHRYPELIRRYLASVVPVRDNFFAALNSAVFTDGSFVYIPKGVQCPMELSTYFRINDRTTGQFERTLIVADDNSSVSYLEGCTAPAFDSRQLHAAVVELVAHDNATIRYSTVQNWYPGNPTTHEGGVYNFVTKRGLCEGTNSKISWAQVEVGSAITWKYPSCILKGDNSVGEFYSVAVTNGAMQADTGTKMIHLGKNTKSNIISKGISAGKSINGYRGQVYIGPQAEGAKNVSKCDSMLVGTSSQAVTIPHIDVHNDNSTVEHEATVSKMSEEMLLYLAARGLSEEEALRLVVNGFCEQVIKKLPLEFATEVEHLLTLKLEKSVG